MKRRKICSVLKSSLAEALNLKHRLSVSILISIHLSFSIVVSGSGDKKRRSKLTVQDCYFDAYPQKDGFSYYSYLDMILGYLKYCSRCLSQDTRLKDF